MHAATVQQALTRLFEFFPPEQIAQARPPGLGRDARLRLPEADPALEGGGRYAAYEDAHGRLDRRETCILEGHFDKIQHLLESDADSASCPSTRISTGSIKAGKISKADGLRFSPNPQALEMNLKGIFIKS